MANKKKKAAEVKTMYVQYRQLAGDGMSILPKEFSC